MVNYIDSFMKAVLIMFKMHESLSNSLVQCKVKKKLALVSSKCFMVLWKYTYINKIRMNY